MKIRFALLCLGLSATASAADVSQATSSPPQAQATATVLTGVAGIATAKPQGVQRVPSPTVSETRVTRRPDGSLVVNCAQRPNPKLSEQMAAQQAARQVEPRQP
jgi:hypothetical protein